MTKRKVYHVNPNPNGGWDVQKEGGKRRSGHFETKKEAENRGRELAQSGGGPGQLKIHKRNGKFQKEYTYGQDPYPPPG